ncbi:MAG: hypothetical protein JNL38_07645 [Myxococcales bacterium]|nr:hypothetical protein [Myxococcales bacterium]
MKGARSTNDAAQMTSASSVPVDETIRRAGVDDRSASIRAAELEDLFARIRAAVEQGDAAGAMVIIDLLRDALSDNGEANGHRVTAWQRLLGDD